MATITHGGVLPDSAGKTDFYSIIDNGTVTGIVGADVSSIATANKVSGASFFNLSSTPGGAGVIPIANIPTASTTPSNLTGYTANYVFTVTSSFTILPTVGADYYDSALVHFIVVSATTQYVYATQASNIAPTGGTLTKTSGTGDASFTFSGYTAQLPAVDGSLLLNTGTLLKVATATYAADTTKTILNLFPNTRYKVLYNLVHATSAGILYFRFNADTGANYGWSEVWGIEGGGTNNGGGGAGTGANQIEADGSNTAATAYDVGEFNFRTIPGNTKKVVGYGLNTHLTDGSHFLTSSFSGSYTGAADLTSMTILTSGGTLTGTADLYQIL